MRTVDLGQQLADRRPTFHRDQPELFPEFGFQANRGVASAEPNGMYALSH
jgi:hypothetical protein